MDKLNELVELANKMGGESWCYTQSSIFSKGYITGRGGRTIVQTYNGDVPANACQFIRTADPAAILEIAKAFRELEQRAEAAEALNKHLDLAVRKAEGVSETLRRSAEAAESDAELGMQLIKRLERQVLEYQAQIAEMVKQKPVLFRDSQGCFVSKGKGERLIESGEYVTPYYLRPAPAAVSVDLVPDEMYPDHPKMRWVGIDELFPRIEGWNACRDEMLRRIEGLK